MKQPIEWHEECLKNQQSYLVRLKEDADRANEKVCELSRHIARLNTQILTAKQQGKDGFDSERFLKNKS